MNFNEHSGIEGQHAFLSPSQYHWINYDVDRLKERYSTWNAARVGSRLHEWAAETISLGRRQPKNQDTVNMHVNDAIHYGMTPEQPLYYSPNCFGTADAISFDGELLRIHDLKTGVTKASMHQLEVYMAIFCLEYGFDPHEIKAELRIYQSGGKVIEIPDPNFIAELMEKIIFFDAVIDEFKEE